MSKINALFMLLFVALSAYGCTYTQNVHLYLSPELKEEYGYYPSLEVDIVGINDSEKNWLSSYDTDKYFEAENPLRKSLDPVTVEFSEYVIGMTYLARNSKYWSKWKQKGAKEAFILVNLPNVGKGSDGSDARRLSIKIKGNIFSSHNKYIEIRSAGLVLIPKPPKGADDKGRNADAF